MTLEDGGKEVQLIRINDGIVMMRCPEMRGEFVV